MGNRLHPVSCLTLTVPNRSPQVQRIGCLTVSLLVHMLAQTSRGLAVRIINTSLALFALTSCATDGIQPETSSNGRSSQMAAARPTPEQDRELLDTYMALSRSAAGNTGEKEEKAYAVGKDETDPFKLMKWAVAQTDRQKGWRTCMKMKSLQDRGQINSFSPWPFLCRGMFLAEQRMFTQADRMLGGTDIKLASIHYAYVLGHLARKRFDKARKHLKAAEELVQDHPLINLVKAQASADPAEELALLEKVYAVDKDHFWVLQKLAAHYDKAGDPRATELLMKAATIDSENIDLRLQLAERFAKERRYDEAAAQHKAVLEVRPRQESSLNFLIGYSRDSSDTVSELKWLDASIASLGKSDARFFHRAKLLDKLKRGPEAKKVYSGLLNRSEKQLKRLSNEIEVLKQKAEAKGVSDAEKKALNAQLAQKQAEVPVFNERLVASKMFMARWEIAKGTPMNALSFLSEAGDEGNAKLEAMRKEYEMGSPAPAARSIDPIIWNIDAKLKTRFKAAKSRDAYVKGGRMTWTLIFNDNGQVSRVERDEDSSVVDPWFLTGAELLLLTIKCGAKCNGGKLRGNEIEYPARFP